MLRSPCRRTAAPPRRGSVLIVVLVVIVVLALAAYRFSDLMLTELEATTMHASDVQARALADSGVEYVATLLANRTDPSADNLQHNPALFLGVGVVDSPRARNRGRFTIIAPVEQDPTARHIRYGLMDESARLNLNLLDQLQLDDEQSRAILMGLPGMTEEIADAIRDWIDADDTTREYGAESEHYESLTPAYSAKNGPLETTDELLLVRGVTPLLLYGEDANRNGLLDPNENDGDASPPLDNADGLLQLGWNSFLTVHSRESNLRADGTQKIDVNNGLLTDLYDQLAEEFDEDTAKFVVGFRISGPSTKDPQRPADSSSSSSGATTASSSSQSGQQQQQQQFVKGLATAAAGAATQPGGKVTRGGIDLSKGGQYKIKTLWDLVGSSCDVKMDGGTTTNLKSPWPADPGALQSVLPKLIDTLSTTGDEYLEGRININQARREVLVGLPNMTEELADSIIAAHPVDANGAPLAEAIASHSTTGWLFLEGLVDIWTMRDLDPYLTTRGDVYRAQILGFFDGGGPVSRVEVIVDGTKNPPRVIFQRDLYDLGRGYTRLHLLPPGTP